MRARLVLRSVLCAALAGAASLGAAGAAQAAPPAAPLSLKATGSNPPELSWTPVAGAVKYEVEADTEPGFSSPPVHTTTVDTSYVPQTLLAAGDYYWQVRSVDADNTDSDWSTGNDFTISPVDPPTGLSSVAVGDPDAVTPTHPDPPPTLSWTPVAGAKSYTVQVAHDSSYAGAKTYTTQSPALVIPDPLAPQPYVWHVKALLDTGIESEYSADASFTVDSIATPTDLRVVGDDGKTIADDQDVQDVVLDWSPVDGAKSYDLQVSKDDSFSDSSIVDDRSGLLATRYSPATTYDNSQYFWRVRAIDLGGNPTVWSDAQSTAPTFRRQWTERPQVVYPAPSADPATVGDPLYLQWTPVHHASHYEVQMGSDSNFSPKTFSSCEVAGTTYTPGQFLINVGSGSTSVPAADACTPAPGALTYWRVRPLDRPFNSANGDGVLGLWSDTQSLTYNPDAERLTGISPADGATVDVPILSWSPVRGAETYAITVKKGTTTVATVATHSTSYVVQPSSPLAAGDYSWTITAKSAANTAISMTQTHTFTVSGTIPAGTHAPLAAQSGRDSDPATTRAPLLSWTPEPATGTDKITYRLDARPHGAAGWLPVSSTPTGNVIEKSLVYPAVTDPSTLFAAPGLYDWQVKAYAGSQLVDTSSVNTFRVSALSVPAAAQRIGLSGTDLDSGKTCAAPVADVLPTCATVPTTPVIDWDPVPGASFYVVYIAKDANFTNLVENLSTMAATSDTRWAPTFAQLKSALADSEVGESYFVHIRACASTTSCGMDPTSASGSATMQFRKHSPEVHLEGHQLQGSMVTFNWTDYRDTNAGTAWDGVPGSTGADQSAMQYRIEVDDDPHFGSPLDTATVDQSTYTSPAKLYPDGTLYWRVQAIDVDKNDLSWSQTGTFTKLSAVPTLDGPTSGTATGENPVLSWSPQPYAASYTVELYRNGDTAFSNANRVFSTSVKQTAFVYTQPLPQSGSPYVWRVAAVDPSGNSGPFGQQPATFAVDGANPTLVSPAVGLTLPADQLVLRWSPVVGAVSYQVQVQQAAGSTPIDTASTRATAYAPSPQRLIADGGISWRVTAKDGNGQELGTSAWRGLVIKAAPTPLQATSSPRITGTRTVGSTLTVNPGTWPATSPHFTYQWLRNGAPIPGATSSNYLLAFADAATRISVRVTASKSGWGPGSATSNALAIAKAASRVSAYATVSTLKQGRSTSLATTVSVPSAFGNAPTGSIRVTDRLGSGRQRTLKTVSLNASAKGQKTISVRLTGVGLHHLRALYLGSTKIAGSSSPVVKVHTTR